jgi:cobyrinic acid a,c-diamide synthase
LTARIVIAGLASGAGKTTVTVALARALRANGLRVATFKCGPDYLDPTYHARAAGGTCHNLDGWMMGKDAVRATFARATYDADIALVEGVMGVFDGVSPTSDVGSTAEIAHWLEAPVLLVIDASGMARTIAALARGVSETDPLLQVAGVIAQRVGSRGHVELLRKALPSVVGGLPVAAAHAFPERHLGLVQAGAVPDATLEAWGQLATEWIDLERVVAIARRAPAIPTPPPTPRQRTSACRIALAYDEAFHFYYEDNLHRLDAAGAELVRFSPIASETLPRCDGIYIGGGYPEVFAERLSANRTLCDAIAAFEGPIYAECGGLMYLSQGIRTRDGKVHPMVGILPGAAVMSDNLAALGYVEV